MSGVYSYTRKKFSVIVEPPRPLKIDFYFWGDVDIFCCREIFTKMFILAFHFVKRSQAPTAVLFREKLKTKNIAVRSAL